MAVSINGGIQKWSLYNGNPKIKWMMDTTIYTPRIGWRICGKQLDLHTGNNQ